jgi:hypothetical protein
MRTLGIDVLPGDPSAVNAAHELYHVRAKHKAWKEKKAELDKLLDDEDFDCDNERTKSLVIQDLAEWMRSRLFGHDEEPGAEAMEQELKDKAKAGITPDKFLDAVFGKNRLKENATAAKSDKDLPTKGRLTSRVVVTWTGSCE